MRRRFLFVFSVRRVPTTRCNEGLFYGRQPLRYLFLRTFIHMPQNTCSKLRINFKIAHFVFKLCQSINWGNKSRNDRKRNFWHERPATTQIRLRIRAVWSESSLSAWRKFASSAIQNAPSEYPDQTVRMHRLVWIFAGRTCPKVRFLTFRFISIIWYPVYIMHTVFTL